MAKTNTTVSASVSSITAKADKAATGDAGILNIPETSTGKHAVSVAHKAIDTCYNAYYGKGGIADLQAAIAQKTEGMSATVFGIAKEAVKLGGNNLESVRAYFLLLCKDAENYLRGKHTDKESGKAETIEKILPSWQPLKSAINKGMKDFSLNPADFQTEGAFRKAAKAKRDAAKETEGGNAQTPVNGNAGSNTGHGLAARPLTGYSATMKVALDMLNREVLTLTESAQNDAAVWVAELTQRIKDYAKTHEPLAGSEVSLAANG